MIVAKKFSYAMLAMSTTLAVLAVATRYAHVAKLLFVGIDVAYAFWVSYSGHKLCCFRN